MKVITIFGGPRKKGNTATMLGWVEEELKIHGHEVDRVNVIDYHINGCLGCLNCKKYPDELGCVQHDDAPQIYERMIDADAVLWAAPLYAWGFPGQMKLLLDRAFSLTTGTHGGGDYKSLVEGRECALLVTCGGHLENNADLIVETFKRILNYAKMTPAGELLMPSCSTPDQLGEEAQAQARTLANQIIASQPISVTT